MIQGIRGITWLQWCPSFLLEDLWPYPPHLSVASGRYRASKQALECSNCTHHWLAFVLLVNKVYPVRQFLWRLLVLSVTSLCDFSLWLLSVTSLCDISLVLHLIWTWILSCCTCPLIQSSCNVRFRNKHLYQEVGWCVIYHRELIQTHWTRTLNCKNSNSFSVTLYLDSLILMIYRLFVDSMPISWYPTAC